MKLDRNELSKAVRMALSMSAVAAVGAAGTAYAQDQNATQDQNNQPQTLQTIVVTGSHIRRVDLETSNPVITVDRQQIQNSGKLTMGDIIQDIPAITGGVQNPQVNNGGGSGSSAVGLRGLGAQRTLVLVNGQRVIGAASGTDLNSIPASAVERVEVLTDGASAVYGSDAIGGVINVILRSNYQGAEFGADYGISDHDDGARRGFHFMFGQTSDKGSILAGVDYNKFDPVLQSARKFSENAVSVTAHYYGPTYAASYPGTPNAFVGGSSFPARLRVGLPPNLQAQFGCSNVALNGTGNTPSTTSDPTLADFHCFSNTLDKYNYASVNLLMTPQERTNGYFTGTYHLTDNIDADFTYYHNKTSSGFQLAPALLGSVYGAKISADNMYNPFGVNYNQTTGYDYRARLVSAGNRAARTNNTLDQAMFDLKGNFNMGPQNWSWDVGYNWGHISTVATLLGLPNVDKLNQAMGPSKLNNEGVPTCVSDINGSAEPGDPNVITGCTPFDPFNLFTPASIATLESVASPALDNFYSKNAVEHVDLNGGLFDLPAGTVQLGVGASYRTVYTHSVIDPVLILDPTTGTCTLGSQCSAPLQGGYTVKEAYAEAFIPILKDLPFFRALNVTLGDRYSKYSTFGSTSNWKAAIEWKPIDDLLLRGTVAKVFRAPTVGDVFSSPISSAPSLGSDPCDGQTTPNPACVGVPLDGSFVDQDVLLGQQIKALSSGSAYAGFPLGPESGKSFDWGFVYSPSFVPGLSVSADYWRVYLNNVITGIGAQTVLNLCYNGVTSYCPLIKRFGATSSQPGQISQILQPTGNLGRLDVRGVDASLRYKLPQFSFGQFDLGIDATYMAQYDIDTAPGLPGDITYHAAGQFGGIGSGLAASCPSAFGAVCLFPRVRGQAYLNWQLGSWNASWHSRYIGHFDNGSYQIDQGNSAVSGTPNPVTGIQVYHYGDTVYNDLQVGYTIEPINTRLDIGVDNVFDKQPPFLYANNTQNANTDPNDFDMMGRYYWGRVTVKF